MRGEWKVECVNDPSNYLLRTSEWLNHQIWNESIVNEPIAIQLVDPSGSQSISTNTNLVLFQGSKKVWAIYYKSLTWMFRPFWGSDSLPKLPKRGKTPVPGGFLVAINCLEKVPSIKGAWILAPPNHPNKPEFFFSYSRKDSLIPHPGNWEKQENNNYWPSWKLNDSGENPIINILKTNQKFF